MEEMSVLFSETATQLLHIMMDGNCPDRAAKTAVKPGAVLNKIRLATKMIFDRARVELFGTELTRFRRYCLYLSRVVSEPIFVKVGANDGITQDPCSDIFLANTKWKGLLIEPVPYCFDRLKANAQRFCLEQVAVGATAGEETFDYVDQDAIQSIPDLPSWFDQLGSFDKSHIVKHLNGVLAPYIIELIVGVLPLADVISRNGIRDVHLLHIDTEGHDYEVLKTLNFEDQAPVAIFVEHKHLSDAQRTEMHEFLSNHGYSVHDCGADYFAVNNVADRRLRS
jgi:FkbM family methyltransferase